MCSSSRRCPSAATVLTSCWGESVRGHSPGFLESHLHKHLCPYLYRSRRLNEAWSSNLLQTVNGSLQRVHARSVALLLGRHLRDTCVTRGSRVQLGFTYVAGTLVREFRKLALGAQMCIAESEWVSVCAIAPSVVRTTDLLSLEGILLLRRISQSRRHSLALCSQSLARYVKLVSGWMW